MCSDIYKITMSKDTEFGIETARRLWGSSLTVKTKNGWIGYIRGYFPKAVQNKVFSGVKIEKLHGKELELVEELSEKNKLYATT